MIATTTQSENEAVKKMLEDVLEAMKGVPLKTVEILWEVLLELLSNNWGEITKIFIAILFYAVIFAFLGKWGTLGRVLYSFFYFGIIFVICLIWGPSILLNNVFTIFCALLLYPGCYLLVGVILRKMRFKR